MNRTGTYVAFDGQGSTDPTESDIHYFNLLKAWNKSGSIDFRFTNSHGAYDRINLSELP